MHNGVHKNGISILVFYSFQSAKLTFMRIDITEYGKSETKSVVISLDLWVADKWVIELITRHNQGTAFLLAKKARGAHHLNRTVLDKCLLQFNWF